MSTHLTDHLYPKGRSAAEPDLMPNVLDSDGQIITFTSTKRKTSESTVVNLGDSPNSNNGDPLRTAFAKINNYMEAGYWVNEGINHKFAEIDSDLRSGVKFFTDSDERYSASILDASKVRFSGTPNQIQVKGSRVHSANNPHDFDSEITITVGLASDLKVHNLQVYTSAVFDSDIVVSGSLTVQGTTTTLNTQNLEIEDNVVVLNKSTTVPQTPVAGNNSGFIFTRYDSDTVSSTNYNGIAVWDEANDKFVFGETGSSGILLGSPVTKEYLTASSNTVVAGPAVSGNILKINGTTGGTSNLTSSVTSGTQNVFNNVTGGTLNIGNVGTGTANIWKSGTINLGTSTTAGTAVNIGGAVSGNVLTIRGTAAGTSSLLSSVTTGTQNAFTGITSGTLNIGNVGTGIANIWKSGTINLGNSTTATTTVNVGGAFSGNTLKINGTAAGTSNLTSAVTTGSQNVFNNITTGSLNIGSSATGTVSIWKSGNINLGTSTTAVTTVNVGGAFSGNTLKINGTASGTTNLTSAVTTGTQNAFTGITSGTLNIAGASSITNLRGNVNIGSTNTNNVTFVADVDSNILPETNITYDLGSSTQKWRNLYVNGLVASSVTAANASAPAAPANGAIYFNTSDNTLYIYSTAAGAWIDSGTITNTSGTYRYELDGGSF